MRLPRGPELQVNLLKSNSPPYPQAVRIGELSENEPHYSPARGVFFFPHPPTFDRVQKLPYILRAWDLDYCNGSHRRRFVRFMFRRNLREHLTDAGTILYYRGADSLPRTPGATRFPYENYLAARHKHLPNNTPTTSKPHIDTKYFI